MARPKKSQARLVGGAAPEIGPELSEQGQQEGFCSSVAWAHSLVQMMIKCLRQHTKINNRQ